ncbi:MAG: SMP-30/gluconolactonase/LRE family protein [Actinomycetota bacterium]|nr:SMP-30/gluconolactonase/LRE family protein [Actinomycetota bacterium]
MDVIVDGLSFAEGPRWRDDRLWLSDFFTESVLAVGLDGSVATVAQVPGGPSGLGWLPDGRLVVVAIQQRRLLRLEDGALVEHADLSRHASYPCNDMVVDAAGRAYVGACDFGGLPNPATSELLLVAPDGAVTVADPSLRFPNGAVVTDGGATLVVAESTGSCLTAFSVGDGGALSDRRTWAPLDGGVADGICLDAEGAIWYADPVHRCCVRVREGGEVLGRVDTAQRCYACALGGPDGTLLFLVTGKLLAAVDALARRPGRVEAVTVEVPAAGAAPG